MMSHLLESRDWSAFGMFGLKFCDMEFGDEFLVSGGEL